MSVSYYKKQIQVAKKFGVSSGTITNWINYAKQGKINVQLVEIDGVSYIINNQHNEAELAKLAKKAGKYRSDEVETDVYVKDELYEMLNEKQIMSLINSLRIYKEIPMKFCYLGEGASIWNDFYSQSVYDVPHVDMYFLDTLFGLIEIYARSFDAINVIDIGVGNGMPVLNFIKKLKELKLLNKYVAVDISPVMLKIAETNLKKIVGSSFVSHCLDIEAEYLQDIAFKYKSLNDDNKTLNIFTFMGGTLGNMGSLNHQSQVLRNIQSGMYPEDILIISSQLDMIFNRTIFPFEIPDSDFQELQIPYMLGLADDMFSKEMNYNGQDDIREYNLILKRNVNIHFKELSYPAIQLKKFDKINVWKHKRDTFEFIQKKFANANIRIENIVKHPEETGVIYMGRVANGSN